MISAQCSEENLSLLNKWFVFHHKVDHGPFVYQLSDYFVLEVNRDCDTLASAFLIIVRGIDRPKKWNLDSGNDESAEKTGCARMKNCNLQLSEFPRSRSIKWDEVPLRLSPKESVGSSKSMDVFKAFLAIFYSVLLVFPKFFLFFQVCRLVPVFNMNRKSRRHSCFSLGSMIEYIAVSAIAKNPHPVLLSGV